MTAQPPTTSALPRRLARVRPIGAGTQGASAGRGPSAAPEAVWVACDAEDFTSAAGRLWTVTEPPLEGSASNASSPARRGWEPGDDVHEDAFRFLAPCVPSNILGMAHNTGPEGRALPPQAFHKAATSVIGPGDAIEVPAGARVEPEAELAIVVGRTARGLTPADAMSAVLGFTVGNDVTDRSALATDELWISAKSADTFTPLGPWLVTRRPADDAVVRVAVDGAPLRAGRVADLGWGLVDILVYASSFMTLHPGDVILTGFPGASTAITAGDTVECTVGGVGSLVNPVAAAPA